MDEKSLRRISIINKAGFGIACLIMFFLVMQLPETSLVNRRSQFSQTVKNHAAEDELKKEAVSLLEMIDYTQSQSRGIVGAVLLFNSFVIVLFGANLFMLRKMVKGKPEIQ